MESNRQAQIERTLKESLEDKNLRIIGNIIGTSDKARGQITVNIGSDNEDSDEIQEEAKIGPENQESPQQIRCCPS